LSHTYVVPTLDHSIADNIDRLSNAIVVPPPKENVNRSVQKSGVLDADGGFVANSITWRNRSQVNTEPPMPTADEIGELSGRFMFAGPLFGHFGHFLVESICRLWAVDQLRGEVDGVIFVPKFQNRPQHVLSVYQPLIEMLGVDIPVHNLEDPTRVETLFVPQQGFGMFEMIEGAPEFREFIGKFAGKSVPAKGPEKIYVSRTALPPQRGSLLGEKRLEELLEAEGYVAFHPQKHSFQEQIEAYRAARYIISIDGSPLHLLALVGDPEQRVACIARRAGDLDQIFARQLKAFQDIETTTISAIVDNWIPETDNRPSRVSFGEVDFSKIYEALRAGGFISSDNTWEAFSDKDRSELLDELAGSQNVEFKRFVNP